jgi:hypothetical protein
MVCYLCVRRNCKMFLGFLDQCHLAFGGLRKEATKRTESAPDRKLGEVTEREEERTIPTYNPMHLPMPSIAQALTHVNTGPSTSSTSASLVHATVVAGAASRQVNDRRAWAGVSPTGRAV